MNEAFVGLYLEEAQAESPTFHVIESAPPARPLSNRAPRKKKANAENTEPKAPRVQLWGARRVLRCREKAENGAAILEATCAREEAFSVSFAQALATSQIGFDSASANHFLAE